MSTTITVEEAQAKLKELIHELADRRVGGRQIKNLADPGSGLEQHPYDAQLP